MMDFQRIRRVVSEPPAAFAAAGFLALIVPALVYGPWLPFLDLLAFVGLDSFPPGQSAGPLHFAVLQFTYVGQYVLSRLLVDLGVSPAGQVVLLYLLQALLLFGVLQWLLRRLVARAWPCALAISGGVLAFWDMPFLWGGPLAFSLAAVALALATALTLAEIERPRPTARIFVALLAVVAMTCHPFAFPFATLLVALRCVFLRDARWHSVALGIGLAVFAWVIRRDNLEGPGPLQLAQLFNVVPSAIVLRLAGLFVADAAAVEVLFGFVPGLLRGYFVVLGIVHLLAFCCAPFVAWQARERPALRCLAALVSCVGAMYLFSLENEAIGEWPQRILTFYSVFTYVGGVVFPGYLAGRWRARRRAQTDGALVPSTPVVPKLAWAAPVVLLAAMVWVQVPILRMGEGIERNYRALRASILQTGPVNAFVVFKHVDVIAPFYLRAVQFLLFSDAELLRRNLIFSTEWHMQPRHPTRLIENWFEIGRPRYEATFTCTDGRLALTFELCPPAMAPLGIGNHHTTFGAPPQLALRQRQLGIEMMQLGAPREAVAHFNAVVRLFPQNAEAQTNLAVALIRLGRHTDALPHAEIAVRIDPRSPATRINYGTALLGVGKTEDGVRQFEAAIELAPAVAQWRIEYAGALLQAGRRAEAAAQFEQVLRVDPQNALVRQELAKLRAP